MEVLGSLQPCCAPQSEMQNLRLPRVLHADETTVWLVCPLKDEAYCSKELGNVTRENWSWSS